jgi:hypothetical protein
MQKIAGIRQHRLKRKQKAISYLTTTTKNSSSNNKNNKNLIPF